MGAAPTACLERWPPSHGLLHTVQSLQLPHWQSLHLHLGRWAQGFTSSRCCSQPKPSERREVKERLRFAVPAPQEALHASHADHWLTMQSEVSHASCGAASRWSLRCEPASPLARKARQAAHRSRHAPGDNSAP